MSALLAYNSCYLYYNITKNEHTKFIYYRISPHAVVFKVGELAVTKRVISLVNIFDVYIYICFMQ